MRDEARLVCTRTGSGWIIEKVLPGRVMVTAFDFTVAFANSFVDGLVGFIAEVLGEAVVGFAGGTGVTGGFAFVGLEVVHNSD